MFLTLVFVILTLKYIRPESEKYVVVDKEFEAIARITSIHERDTYISYELDNVIVRKGTSISSSEKILVYQYNNSNSFKIGNVINLKGEATPFEKAGNPGGFDAYKYYRSQNYAYMVCSSEISVLNGKYNYYKEFVRKLTKKWSEVYYKLLPENEASIINGIILGDKHRIDEDDEFLYEKNGIMHIMAVSGMHVSTISMFILFIVSKLPINFNVGRLIVAMSLIFYGSIVGFSVSCTRAVIMILIKVYADVKGYCYDTLSAIGFSGVIILLINPLQLFNSGFLLSYVAVITIAYINSVYDGMFKSIYISLAVQISTLPILLYYFYEAPLYSVIINMLVLPLMTVLFVMGLLSGIIGACSSVFGSFFAGAVHYILSFYDGICRFFGEVIGEFRVTGYPDRFQIVVYYILIIIIVFVLKCSFKSKYKIALTTVVLLISCIVISYDYSPGLNITMLDIGQGDGIYIETPDNSVIMVDGGSSSKKNVAENIIEPFMKYKGKKHIDMWIITHMDSDHSSGLLEELNRYRTSGITIGSIVLPDIYDKENEFDLINHSDIVYMHKGQSYNEGEFSLKCIHPIKNYNAENKNEYSLVLNISYGEFDMLLTGDVEGEAEKNLDIDKGKTYEVLKVAHHGSNSSTSVEFLGDMKVKYALISSGKDNIYGHPHSEVIERLKLKNVNILRTDTFGAISINSDGKYMNIE